MAFSQCCAASAALHLPAIHSVGFVDAEGGANDDKLRTDRRRTAEDKVDAVHSIVKLGILTV